ncbi:hydroxypyruvate isomerase family protein [Amycolatopsis roodepoortensis]|uniref:Hydroxypyruvate isomerase n=1 Tax=Amycolatopsis roodepoortensis TaxID=700274 RepID=A0ABR9L962_9PSEU|nr:TIM barrel protein [Amycolatopsis roodepoortensis]MBE1577087.1 hydroxypyruvate isomerase [Amycolatopsis roodepoortensis]
MILHNGLRLDANLKWLFTELPFEQRFDAAAAAGFTAVEYASPYLFPVATLVRRLADAGLTQILVNSPTGGPGSPERLGYACLPGRAAEFRAGVELGLEYAVALNSSFLHLPAGIRPSDVSRDRAFAQYVANIAWAADKARGTGVRLLLEAQNKQDAPGFVLDDQEHAAAVADAIDQPHVRLLLDVYHAAIDEKDVVTAVRKFLPRAAHLQIADSPGRAEPGTGRIPWADIFDTLRSEGYDGWIGCEYRPAAGTEAGLSWTKEQIR